MKKKNMKNRLLFYLGGFLILTFGIAISVKSNLGVSPVSSVPYTMTCIWGIEMGKATILFQSLLVLVQFFILRRRFQLRNLLQILVGVIFGYFTTFFNYLLSFVPTPESIVIRVLMALISTVLIAFGIFFYVSGDIMPLSIEGTTLTISQVTKKPFPTIKLLFDLAMVLLSLGTCLLFLGQLGSVGIGTVAAAILVGPELKGILRLLGSWRDRILNPQPVNSHSVNHIGIL